MGSGVYISHSWFFVFDTTRDMVMRVDFGRLFLIDAIIAAVGGLLAWTCFRNSTGRRAIVRIVFYTFVVASIAVAICLSMLLFQNVQEEITKRAAQSMRFDPSTGTLVERSAEAFLNKPEPGKESPYDALIAYLAKKQPVTVDIPGHGTVIYPAGMSSAEIAAAIKKQFFSDGPWTQFNPAKYLAEKKTVLTADDLKKITLFDVAPDMWYTGISGFHGRVRNRLSRAIEKIGIKASFYDAAGELIEVRTFWMKDTTGSERVFPNTPVSFEGYLAVKHLPDGWKYQLEVTEARYVPDVFDPSKPFEVIKPTTKKPLNFDEFISDLPPRSPTPEPSPRRDIFDQIILPSPTPKP